MSVNAAETFESTRVTQLGVFAGRVIEAGWLGVAMILPLYFTPFQGTSFEGPKTHLFRIIVAFMALAWVVKANEEGSWRKQAVILGRNPLTVPVALFALVTLLSTLTSVAPALSLWGMSPRYQGLYTTLALVAFFFLVALEFRERAQLERLTTVLLFTSLPVSLYALLQQWNLDPVRGSTFEVREEWRVASTLGQHIFLGAYLLFVIPLCVARILEAWQARGTTPEPGRRWERDLLAWTGIILAVNLGLYGFIVRASQADQKTLWWTFEGLLAAMLLVVSWGVTWISRPLPARIRLAAYSGLLLAQAVVLLISLARGPWLAMLAGGFSFFVLYALRYQHRKILVATVAATVAVSGFLVVLNLPNSPLTPLKRQRILHRLGNLWEVEAGAGLQRLNIWRTSLKGVWEHPPLTVPDHFNLLRPVLGYGPETFSLVFDRILPLGMGKRDSWSPRVDRAHNHLIQLLVTQGLAGVAAYLAVVGSFLLMAFRKLRRLDGFPALFLIAAVGAVVAEVVELQVGIALTVTTAFFFLFVAVASLLPEAEREESAEASSEPANAMVPKGERSGDGGRRKKEAENPSSAARTGATRWALWAMAAYLFLTLHGQWLFAQPLSADSVGPGLVASFTWMIVGLLLLAMGLGRLPAAPVWRGWSRGWVHLLGAMGFLLLAGVSLNLVMADITFLFGRDLYRQRRLMDTAIMYQRAIRLNPTQDMYYQGLAEALVGLAQEAPEGRVSAEPPPDDLLTLTPSRVGSLSRDGLLALAVASQRQAWRVDPLEAAMGFYLAKVLELQAVNGHPERFGEALAIYRRLSQMSPNRIRIYHDWIMVALRAGRLEEAQEVAKTLLAMAPTHPLVQGTMAVLYHQMGQTDLARAEAQKALSHPIPPRAQYLRTFFNVLKRAFPSSG